nr:hypothetical protein Iba_chr02bCG12120 [Ipomoea batatas]
MQIPTSLLWVKSSLAIPFKGVDAKLICALSSSRRFEHRFIKHACYSGQKTASGSENRLLRENIKAKKTTDPERRTTACINLPACSVEKIGRRPFKAVKLSVCCAGVVCYFHEDGSIDASFWQRNVFVYEDVRVLNAIAGDVIIDIGMVERLLDWSLSNISLFTGYIVLWSHYNKCRTLIIASSGEQTVDSLSTAREPGINLEACGELQQSDESLLKSKIKMGGETKADCTLLSNLNLTSERQMDGDGGVELRRTWSGTGGAAIQDQHMRADIFAVHFFSLR